MCTDQPFDRHKTIRVNASGPLGHYRADQRLPLTDPQTIPVFAPFRVVTSVKFTRPPLCALNRDIVRQFSIERLDKSFNAQTRPRVNQTDYLAGRMDSGVGPSREDSANRRAGKRLNDPLKLALHRALAHLTLRAGKLSPIVREPKLDLWSRAI